MRPTISLDTAVLAENARVWRAFAQAELYAVVKADGYGWGLERVVPPLEAHADAFCVADEDELRALRRVTRKPAVILGRVPESALPEVPAAGAMPTIESAEDLAAVRGSGDDTLPLRVGLRPAAAWSGLDMEALRTLAPALAESGRSVQFWSHITDVERAAEQTAAFDQALQVLQEAGVQVAGSDLCSTFALAGGTRRGTAVRVGVGLFGAAADRVPGLQCALRVEAPVVRSAAYAAGTRTGYGAQALEGDAEIVTARCGYSDGFPAGGVGGGLLAVGMQYVTVIADNRMRVKTRLTLMDASTDLDAVAAKSGRLPHEIVTALGNSARVARTGV